MKLSCIAIDDEPLALVIVQEYCEKIPFLKLVHTFNNALDALAFMKTNQVNLLFLDIQMEDITGLQLLNIISPMPRVIITSAYDSFALKGYDLNVVDYLLKPFSFDRLLKASSKAYKMDDEKSSHGMGVADHPATSASDDYFFVKTEFRYVKVNVNDILFIEGMGDYLRIVTTQKNIMTLRNFREIEELIPSGCFLRVHKSYIVALNKIEKVERNIISIAGKKIPVGSTYKKDFFRFIETKKMG